MNLHKQQQNCKTRAEKKELLKLLSLKAKEFIELGETEAQNVNGVLMEWLTTKKHQKFNTFFNWKKQGYKVKKGEKAFFIWSKKLKTKDKEKSTAEEEKEFSFFSIAYLFSNAQVEPLKEKESA